MSGKDAALPAAMTAGEGIRLLNHATIRRRFPPSGAYDVLGQLVAMASRVPQTLEQLTGDIRELHNAGRLPSDRGAAVGESVAALELAMADAQTLHDGQSRAQSAISDVALAAEGEE